MFQKLLLNFTWYVLIYDTTEFGWKLTVFIGGLIVKTLEGTTSLKEVSWGWITLALSIDQNHFPPGVYFVKQMALPGWHFIVSICACITAMLGSCLYSTHVHLRLNMALELAKTNPVYEDIASKFFEVGLQCLSIQNQISSIFFSISSSLPTP